MIEKNYIDLGLPSGTLWCDTNKKGYYNWNDAVKKFGDNMPKLTDFAELYDYCKWEWNEDKKGMVVTGPNGNKIFLPASGCRFACDGSLHYIGLSGSYWSGSSSNYNAYFLDFSDTNVYPAACDKKGFGHSIRLIKRVRK